MANQQFCLKWNNHQGNLISVFDNLLSKGSLVDVTLACEGTSIKAHKVVLSACSPFFEEIFQNNPCKHPVVILKDLKFEDMKTIIQFMYKGEVNVTQDRLSTLLKTAENLKIKGLAEFSNDNRSPDEASIPQSSVSEKQCNSSPSRPGRPKKKLIIDNNQLSDQMEACSPEIIEDAPVEHNKNSSPPPASTSREPAFTSDRSMEFNVPKSSYDSAYDSNKDSNQRISPDSFRHEMASEDYDGSSFPKRVKREKSCSENDEDIQSPNWTQSSSNQYDGSSFSMTSENQQSTNIIKQDSPQNLPIPVEQEISGMKESENFDPGNSADSFSDQSFQGHSFSMSMHESSNPNELQIDNLVNQSMSSNANFSQDDPVIAKIQRSSQCPICKKEFKYRSGMLRHYRYKHNSPTEVYRCHLCEQSFGWLNQLSNHLDSVHNIEKEFECGSCGRYFHHAARAEHHIRNTHYGKNVQIKHHPQYRKSIY